MPLVGFRPTKARLIIEDRKESVLVMKVVLDPSDAVELVTGGTLKDLPGILRIRERKAGAANNGSDPLGSMVFVREQNGAESTAARYQVNVLMSSEKFGTLLRVANAGRLPNKFFVDADARGARKDPGLGYLVRRGTRVKLWDNHAHRSLPLWNFVMILPIDVPTTTSAAAAEPEVLRDVAMPGLAPTDSHVADLVDDMLVFQSDTRSTMFGLVSVVAVVAVAALAIALALFFR